MADDMDKGVSQQEQGGPANEEDLFDTMSMKSSITKYRVEGGRTYHAYKDGIYWAPNDDQQNESLDIQHHMFLLLLDGKLHLAPIDPNIKRVLDVGTGPPNCSFEIDDVHDEWLYPVNYFGLVHIRNLFGSIDDWPGVYQQALRHIKPGGYIEQVEISVHVASDDGSVGPESPIVEYGRLFIEAGEITGQTFEICDKMKGYIEDAGFINVKETVFKVPMGGWSDRQEDKDLGMFAHLGFDVGMSGYSNFLIRVLGGWIRANLRDPKVHAYHFIKVVYAQKPL